MNAPLSDGFIGTGQAGFSRSSRCPPAGAMLVGKLFDADWEHTFLDAPMTYDN